jgi:hypothetical protein
MYLFMVLLASGILMWALHKKSREDDDDGPMWS